MSCRYAILEAFFALLFLAGKFAGEGAPGLEFLLVVSSNSEFNTSGVVPAVNLALQSASTWSLSFNLSYYTILDSKCDYDHSLKVLQSALEEAPPSVVAVIGCGCSTATEAVADIPQLWSLPVISYASSSTSLNNENKYQNVFRTIPDSRDIVDGLVAFVDYFQWKQVMVITQEISATEQHFNATFHQHNITAEVWTLSSVTDFHEEQLIQNTTQRIFILDVSVFTTQYYICQAYWSSKYYPGYAWVIVDNFAQSDWWTINNHSGHAATNCTQSQFETVLNYSIIVTSLPPDYNEEYSADAKFLAYAYDAVGSLALALNRTACQAKADDLSTCNLTMLMNEISTIQFPGTSGMVAFDAYGSRANANVQFLQHRQSQDGFVTTAVAVYTDEDITLLGTESIATIWPDGVPSDGIPLMVITYSSFAILALGTLYFAVGVVLSIIFLVFTLRYQNNPLIRLTSPKLNVVFIVGAILMYGSILLYVLPSFNAVVAEIVCETRTSLAFVFGYNLCIAVTLAKLWRVYYIFKNPKPNRRMPKDKHLAIVVAVIIVPEFIINVILSVINVLSNGADLILNGERPSDINQTTGEVTEYYIWVCEFNAVNTIDGLLLVAYKIVIHAVALFLIIGSRKIKLSAVNDYRSNSAIVYIETAMYLILLVGVSLLRSYPNYYAFLSATMLFIGATAFVTLTFIPKMVALYKDPNGGKVFNEEMNDVNVHNLFKKEQLQEHNGQNGNEARKSNHTILKSQDA